MATSTAAELEQWLRREADIRTKKAESRRHYARSGKNLTNEDLKLAHVLAEKMAGRKLPRRSRLEEERNNAIEERIASKLDQEAAMIRRFADFVHSSGGSQ